MTKITFILFSFFIIISCVKRTDKCNVKLKYSRCTLKNNVYYDIKLDSINNILTLNIINKTEQNILVLKPEILFLKEKSDNSQTEKDNRTKFETINFDTIKKSTSYIKEYGSIQEKFINMWQRRKIRHKNNNYFDYGYNIKDYLVIIEKDKPYKEEYFIDCSRTDKGSYKIIFDTGFRNDSLVQNFINPNYLQNDLSFYKKSIDYPSDTSILIQ